MRGKEIKGGIRYVYKYASVFAQMAKGGGLSWEPHRKKIIKPGHKEERSFDVSKSVGPFMPLRWYRRRGGLGIRWTQLGS